MRPDGIAEGPQDDGRKRRPRPQRGRSLQRRLLEWLNSLRGALGLRRVHIGVGLDHVPRGTSATEDDDPEAFRRALPYGVAAMGFAAVVFAVFWVYGMVARGPIAMEEARARQLALQAIDHLGTGDVATARKLRDQIEDRHRRDPAVCFLDGHLLAVEHADGAAAVEKLSRRTWSRKRAARNLVTLAGYHQATRDLQAALRALSKAAELRPNDVTIRLLKATALLATGAAEEALGEAKELEDRIGPSAGVLNLRGYAHLALDKPELARRDFEAGLLYGSTTLRLRLGLADALTRLGEYYAAAEQAEAVLRYYPDSADAWARLGIVREKLEDLEGAEGAYQKAIEADPKRLMALNNLAYLLCVAKKDPAQALPYAERAHELAPSFGPVLDTLGWTYHLLGRQKEALPLLRKAADLMPEVWEAQLHLAQTLLALGKRVEGVRVLKEIARAEGASSFGAQAREKLRALGEA